MPYIGKSPVGGGFHKLDNLTASATATYALTLGSAAYYPETANQLLVSLNGVIQAPQDSFTVSGSNLIFDTALTASDSIDFVVALGDVLGVQGVTDGAVTTNKIANGAVTAAKLAAGVQGVAGITTASTSGTAMSIDSSNRILTPARPAFHVRYSAANSAGVQGDIVFNEVDFNTGGHYSTSNGRFTAPISGLYWFSFQSLTAGTTGGGTVPANTAAAVRFDKNGLGGSWSPKAYFYDASSAGYSYINLTHIIELSANDYIQVNFTDLYAYSDGSGNFDPTFQGYLIG